MLVEDIRHPEKQPVVFERRCYINSAVWMEIRLRKGISKKRGFQTPGKTLTVKSVASLRTSKGNITGGKNK